MGTKNDGRQAFPASPMVTPSGTIYRPADAGCEGISARLYIATAVVAALAASPLELDALVRQAYEVADLMLLLENE